MSSSIAAGEPQRGRAGAPSSMLTAGAAPLAPGPHGEAGRGRGASPSWSLEMLGLGTPGHCSPQDLVLRPSLGARALPGGWLLLRKGLGEGERARPRRGLRGAGLAEVCAWMCASNMPTFWFTCTFCNSRCRTRSFLWASSGPGGLRGPAAAPCCPSPRRRPAQRGLLTPLPLLLPPLLLFSRRRPLPQPLGLPGSSGDAASVGGKRKETSLPGLNTLPGLRVALPGGGAVSLPPGRGPPLRTWSALFMTTRLLSAQHTAIVLGPAPPRRPLRPRRPRLPAQPRRPRGRGSARRGWGMAWAAREGRDGGLSPRPELHTPRRPAETQGEKSGPHAGGGGYGEGTPGAAGPQPVGWGSGIGCPWTSRWGCARTQPGGCRRPARWGCGVPFPRALPPFPLVCCCSGGVFTPQTPRRAPGATRMGRGRPPLDPSAPWAPLSRGTVHPLRASAWANPGCIGQHGASPPLDFRTSPLHPPRPPGTDPERPCAGPASPRRRRLRSGPGGPRARPVPFLPGPGGCVPGPRRWGRAAGPQSRGLQPPLCPRPPNHCALCVWARLRASGS